MLCKNKHDILKSLHRLCTNSKVKFKRTKHSYSQTFKVLKFSSDTPNADPGFPVGGCFSGKMYAKTKELGPLGGVPLPPRSANGNLLDDNKW